MFGHLDTARRSLRRFNEEPLAADPSAAKAVVEEAARIEKLAAGIRLRALRNLEADRPTVDWLAGQTGQTKFDAGRDVEAAQAMGPATEAALRDGELSVDQAREVASATAADPSAEASLLESARNESMAELKRKAKAVRAAATDDDTKNTRARKERSLSVGSDPETGKAWWNVSGPAADIAWMNSYLEPFVQARFDRAREVGERESRGAYAFDALLDALRSGSAKSSGAVKPAKSRARILARIDVTALKRGHAVTGETVDIRGIGPVPVEAIRELLPDATIELIITNGVDIWNVTSLARHPNATQQTVLDWLGVQCTRQGCGATRNLQIDHRHDWAKTHVTKLSDLDPLCTPDHGKKTREGWALVDGTGRRPMVPPDHPDHPANSPPANAPPTQSAA